MLQSVRLGCPGVRQQPNGSGHLRQPLAGDRRNPPARLASTAGQALYSRQTIAQSDAVRKFSGLRACAYKHPTHPVDRRIATARQVPSFIFNSRYETFTAKLLEKLKDLMFA